MRSKLNLDSPFHRPVFMTGERGRVNYNSKTTDMTMLCRMDGLLPQSRSHRLFLSRSGKDHNTDATSGSQPESQPNVRISNQISLLYSQ